MGRLCSRRVGHRPCASFAMTLRDDCVGPRNTAQPGFATSKGFVSAVSRALAGSLLTGAVIVSDLPTRTFKDGPLRGVLPPDVPCVGMHRASFAPRDPPRTPTAKDFAVEGRPVEIGQSSWLSAPDRPEQGGDKIDVLLLYKSNQISDDGARLIRVVRRVGDDRGATRASQLECISQMFRLRRHRAVGW